MSKHTLRVDQMTDDFANAPFAFGIAVRLAFRRYPAQQHIQSVRLGTQHRKNLLLGHLPNIALIVRSVFRFEWLSSHVIVLARFEVAISGTDFTDFSPSPFGEGWGEGL